MSHYISEIYVCLNQVERNPGLVIGMKIEAEDADNALICCGTITNMKQDKVKIHFDGWDKGYDYWTTVSSGKIHHCGWCEEKGMVLCPPRGTKL